MQEILMRAVTVLLLLSGLAFAGHAQERAASGGQDAQASWMALSEKIKFSNVNASDADNRIEQIIACHRNQKVFAPGVSGSDSNGCLGNSNIENIIACARNKTMFNGTNCVPIAPAVATPPTKSCYIQTSIASSSERYGKDKCYGGTGGRKCPSGFLLTGVVADTSSGCEVPHICARVVCV
jgi:hypothetical protein